MQPRCSGRRLLLCHKPPTGQTPVSTANSRRRGKILGELSIAGPILTTIAQMTDTAAVMTLLRNVPLFADLKDEDKVCIEEAEEWQLLEGELLVKPGEPAEHFFVLLEGEITASKKHGDQEIVVARYRPGAFFGEVPLLLGVPYILTARAESDSRLIVFAEEGFWRLLRLCPAISSEIFREMATRLRNIEGSAQQQQKLEALGTMSAGLAHEMNNPSSAAQRIAVHLGEVVRTIQSVAHRLHHTLEHEHWDRLIALVGEILKNPSPGKQYHAIEQSDSEDVLTAWLREGGVSDAWQIAPVFVGAGLEMSALVSLREDLPKNAFGDAVRWIALRMKLETLLDDAEQSTGRIASLVEAVRSIARQERAEAADIDVHEQIRSALGVLDHKLKNARVSQSFSGQSGHVRGYPSELAQVWVSLLDNAADAVDGGGEIAIQTLRDDNQTVVEIIDNGPGIPPENLSHIFEPFFTTKGVGLGKGLGLTISQGIVGDRHGGEIEVESKAGETRFIVRLPVRQIERNEGAEAIVASRAYMAELTEQLEGMESPPPPQTRAVSDRSFATVFDVPLFAQLDEPQRRCLSMGTEVRFARGEIVLGEGDPSNFFYALLEFSRRYDVRILVPMVTLAEDMAQIGRRFRQLADAAGISHPPPLGAMIETPAAALTIKDIMQHADFASIGTNDLTQYTMAAGRENPQVNNYFVEDHPAVLRLIRTVLEEVGQIPVSICGELATDLDTIPTLLKFGIRSLRVAPPLVPGVKEAIRQTSLRIA